MRRLGRSAALSATSLECACRERVVTSLAFLGKMP